MTLKERAKKIKADIPAVFIALKDKDIPIIPKILAGITVAYALSPVVTIWLLLFWLIIKIIWL
ncbi:MAG: hypothetical protein PUH54_09890 [Oscillospiraceae bacterium]|nr:hypothetical protein [Oscillospiraceae bacterium]